MILSSKNYIKKYFLILGGLEKKLPFIVLSFLFLSVLDLIGLGLVGPFVEVVVSTDTVLDSSYHLGSLAVFDGASHSEKIVIISAAMLSVFLAKALLSLLVQKYVIRFAFGLQEDLRCRIMRAYLLTPYQQHMQKNSSDKVQVITQHVQQFIEMGLISLLRLLSEVIIISVICVYLIFINWMAALLLAVMVFGIAFTYDRIMKYRVRRSGSKLSEAGVKIIKNINQVVEGLREIRILGAEAHFYKVFKEDARQSAKAWEYFSFLQVIPRYFLEFILVFFVLMLVLISYFQGIRGVDLIPLISVFGFAAIKLIPSANYIISSLNGFRFSNVAMESLYGDLLGIKNINMEWGFNNEAVDVLPFERFEMSGVVYYYPGSAERGLDSIDFVLRSGESVGIIGPSGSGKTTFVDVLQGLLDPKQGGIFIDGKPLLHKVRQWRRLIAYIPQGVFITDSTLRNNIALGITDTDINESRVLNAIKQAQLDEVVEQLPGGLDTYLGERGLRLSGGQRQRVALARAFYHERDILVMDEATSALDDETEKEIVESIRCLKGKKTIIVIAHRLSTLRHCDRIIRFDNGKIVQEGSYEDVIGCVLDAEELNAK